MEMILQLFTDPQELEEFLQDINLRYIKIYAISIIYHLLQWSINIPYINYFCCVGVHT